MSEQVVVLTGFGVYRGHDGVRQLASRLKAELGECVYEYRTYVVDGELAFLEWTARGGKANVEDGADTYLVGALPPAGTSAEAERLSRRARGGRSLSSGDARRPVDVCRPRGRGMGLSERTRLESPGCCPVLRLGRARQ